MKLNREELVEMVRQEIRSLAYESLRNNSEDKKKNDDKNRIFKPKGLSEEELEYAMFHGGKKPIEHKINNSTTIREGFDNGLPQVSSAEIVKFEDGFEEMLKDVDGASVVFDTQNNGYSLEAGIGKDGIEVGASGIIDLGKNGKIKWSYSMKNGLNVSMDNVSIDKGNKSIIAQLATHYDTWQKEWRDQLTIEPGMETPEEAPMPEAGGEEAVGAPAPGAEEMPEVPGI